ncbi:MAG: hypothetical protein ACREYF_07815 [Gammaproteobacteria bacterium]
MENTRNPRCIAISKSFLSGVNVREWLGWDDEKAKFSNEAHLEEFYSWITPGPEDTEPKLAKALDIRDLSTILEDDAALGVFRGKDGSLTRALAKYEVDHPADWFPQVASTLVAVRGLTPDTLRMLDEKSLDLLQELAHAIQQALKDREKLRQPD